MNIKDIIELRKLGYSKDEVAELIKEPETTETPAETPAEKPQEAPPAPTVTAADLYGAINKLTETIQAGRIQQSEIKTADNNIDKMLSDFLVPPKPEK